jgi:adenine-specific DNA-methyltransferase
MTKPTFETPDLTQSNIEKIGELFPSVITETVDDEKSTPNAKVYKKAVNFEALKQLLTDEVLSGNESYEFTWVGKKASIVEANKPIRKALRPCKEESRDWETTQNLYIEGDNLDVLKLLQESYLGKVKMIYIDPPYNTGNDFVYRDDFRMDKDDYDEESGIFDEEENRLFRNKESNGRFHSDWCSMIYPRLMLARNLLRDDGVIFISIDDNEAVQLQKICDEVFGESNFVACLPTIMNLKGNNDEYAFAGTHEYTVVYCKNKTISVFNEFSIDEETMEEWEQDEISLYKKGANLKATGVNAPREKRPNLWFPIYVNLQGEFSLEKRDDWIEVYPITNNEEMSWRWSKTKFVNQSNDVIVNIDGKNVALYKKQRPSLGDLPSKKPKTLFYKPEYSSGNGTAQIKILFDGKFFNNPKPVNLIQDMMQLGSQKDSIIFDFFSGSATTAHAVMQLNTEDGGNRKFIMVQLPESCEKDSEAFKAGYKNICEIGKERIRRAGNKIKEEAGSNSQSLDIGFRVFKWIVRT